MNPGTCYWRFKGDKAYRFGYATHVEGRLYRMGLWAGDTTHGPIVDYTEIEVSQS